MIAVVQRVTSAQVTVDNQIIGAIGPGLLVLAAILRGDSPDHLQWLARKLTTLRLFKNNDKYFDLDVTQTNGSILLVSQFTLAAQTAQGRRPSLSPAEDPAIAKPLFDQFTEMVRSQNIPVATGRFGAEMQVSSTNDGPVTFLLDSHQALPSPS